MALCTGGTLVFGTREELGPGLALAEFLREREVSVVTLTPTVLGAMSDPQLRNLRMVHAAGETCPAELARRWARGRVFRNLYGPTEATVWSTMAAAPDPSYPCSIGLPVQNARVHLLDGELEPVPIGIAGELYIGGSGLARGYVGDGELTACRFLPDPHSHSAGGHRLYRSGDLAWRAIDGSIQFLGRIDSQVKIRGQRIELGEIEATLLEFPGLSAVAIVEQESQAGSLELVAYYVHDHGSTIPRPDELRRFLEGRLPLAMIPAAFSPIDMIPRTLSGKLDREALARARRSVPQVGAYVPPQAALEMEIALAWGRSWVATAWGSMTTSSASAETLCSWPARIARSNGSWVGS